MPISPCVFSDEVAAEFPDAVRIAAENGCRNLEIRGRLFGKTVAQIDDDDVARMQSVLAEHGARVAVIGSPVGKCADTSEDHRRHQRLFSRMAELAQAFGTRVIRGFALWRPDRKRATDHLRPNLDEHLESITSFLTPIVEEATRENVVLALETEGATMVGTCAEARRVMDALGNPPALGVAWDVNNGLHNGEAPLPDGYALIRDRVYHVHVKPDSSKSLATVADSELTYARLLRLLRDDGYQGAASIEHWGSPEFTLKGIRELVPLLATINSE